MRREGERGREGTGSRDVGKYRNRTREAVRAEGCMREIYYRV